MTNFDKYLNDCDPFKLDTDGDGVDDLSEILQGGNPCDASDLGLPPDDIVTVPFQFFSNYASWEMTIRCVSGNDTRTLRRVTRYWDYSTINTYVKLRKGCSYEVSMRWLDSITTLLYPDTDYYTWRMQVFDTPSAPTTYQDYTEDRKPGVAETVAGVSGVWPDPPFGWFIENAGGLFTTTVFQERIPTRNDAYVPLADRLTATLHVLCEIIAEA
jgi:hypothetical protein